MALLNQLIEFIHGDNFSIRRTLLNLPEAIDKAWLTIKDERADADPGLVQKEIITAINVGVGQIIDDGATDGEGLIQFDIVPADSTPLGLKIWQFYDIQVRTLSGNIQTMERGRIRTKEEVTLAVT